MKALKITTAEGKSIIAGHEDARFISAAYRIYPETGKMQYHVYAVLGPKSEEMYHEWTPEDSTSTSIKLEAIETDSAEPSLRNRPGTHNWNDEGRPELVCSFCGKFKSDVGQLIAGPSVFICDQCVGICNQVLSEKDNDDA